MTSQTEPSATPGPRPPWFVGRPGTVLLYRVNRRPMPQPTLGAPDVPPPLMDHLEHGRPGAVPFSDNLPVSPSWARALTSAFASMSETWIAIAS
jgi:hypothetical protein